ncbi:hypothetical protein STXM2123_3562 [Streptomyces sp. F-3]|nr:hypothetical protein STXM2123_3562 [Streptomyces sp. F-3]
MAGTRDRRLRNGRIQSQFVFAGVRIEYPLVCGVDVVRPPTALRVHGCPNPPSGPRGALSPSRRSDLLHSARPQEDLAASSTGSLTLSGSFGVKRRP